MDQPRRLRDVRWRVLAATAATVAIGGGLLAVMSGDDLFGWHFPRAPRSSHEAARETEARQREIHQRFHQGVVMLHAKQHEHAMTAFHRVLELDPAMPEAHVNMGFALIGLERYAAARDFFETAMALRKEQVNAYYGLAVAFEGLHDRRGAIGAMRTYVHLSAPDDPFRRKAYAALWEWEAERTQASEGTADLTAASGANRMRRDGSSAKVDGPKR